LSNVYYGCLILYFRGFTDVFVHKKKQKNFFLVIISGIAKYKKYKDYKFTHYTPFPLSKQKKTG